MDDAFMTEDEMLAHIGVLLLNVQQFEFLLSGALKQIYANSAELTAEKLFAEDKRTLGVLIRDLLKRAQIDSDADALLGSVLHDRNLFVHGLLLQPWFDTSTDAARRRVWEFLAPFSLNLNRAIRLFVAIHMKHGDEIGFDSLAVRQVKSDPIYEVPAYYSFATKFQKRGS